MAHDLTSPLRLVFETARQDDAAELAALHTEAARELTRRYGRGHWSYEPTERSLARAISSSHVHVARLDGAIVGSFELQTKKPWSIDRTYFTEVPCPLYLLAMAVLPLYQRRGIGRRLLDEAVRTAEAWPAHSLRLDAYDSPASAGAFYEKCGFTETGRVVYKGTPLVYFERLVHVQVASTDLP